MGKRLCDNFFILIFEDMKWMHRKYEGFEVTEGESYLFFKDYVDI